MNRNLLWALAICSSAFVGGFVSIWLCNQMHTVHAQSGSPLPPPPQPIDRPTAFVPDRFDQVIQQVAPSVVAVDAVKPLSGTAAKTKGKSTEEESGSGVIVQFDGFRGHYVVTNNHVVNGAKPNDVTVTLADGRIVQPTRLWTDPESDIAILQIHGENVTVCQLADSDRVKLGQWVLAFGSPFGLHQTVTQGIISARDRGQISLGDTIRIKEFLQTDAAINPGSSGGPLVDLNGNVVGINTAIASNNGNNSGVSFSIPSNLVRRVGKELLEKGTVSRGYLGMQLAPSLEPTVALRLGLTKVSGALVESVHVGGPAALGGIQRGDVILKLDSIEIRNENHLINLISSAPVGQRIKITLWRSKQVLSTDVVVGDWSQVVGKSR